MNFHVERPYPLPSSRIEFIALPPPPFPPTAARMEFGLDVTTADNFMGDREDTQEPPRIPQGTPNAKKISRPNGQPGRPGSGGFNLSVALVRT
ncbi:hypothetical protein DXG01_016751, partial [Tephrocybe rancida]